MTLLSRPYASIASGQKTIELRLYDEKRQSIQKKNKHNMALSESNSNEFKLSSVVW